MTKTTTKATPDANKAAPRAKGRPETGDRVGRDALIAATIEALKEIPFDQLTLADIATRAHVNPALIRYYFGSKDALITASVMSQLEALQVSTEPANDANLSIRDKFVQRLKTIIGIQQDNPHFYQLLMDRAELDVEQNGENLLRKMADRGVLKTVELLYSKSDTPVRSVDPRFLHIALVGACGFFASGKPLLDKLFGPQAVNADLTDRYVEFVADLFLTGLLERSTPA